MSQKWNEEVTEQLISSVGGEKPVSVNTVDSVAKNLGFTPNSVAAKLRKMGFVVESRAKAAHKTFTDSEAVSLEEFVIKNSGKYTFGEIAATFAKGKFSTKQVQGKILSMELTKHVKPTEKVETVKQYSEDEEARLITLLKEGKYVEDIAEALGKSIKSIRGKTLSLLRDNPDLSIPKQKKSYAQAQEDGLSALGDISEMTVEEIAEALGKTPRGVKVMLTHRGISCANHKGANRRAKLDEKAKEKAA